MTFSLSERAMRALWDRARKVRGKACVICLRPATTRHHVAPPPANAPVVSLCLSCHHEIERRTQKMPAMKLLEDIQPPPLFAAVSFELKRRTERFAGVTTPALKRYLAIARADLRRRKAARRERLAEEHPPDEWLRLFRRFHIALEEDRHVILTDHLLGRDDKRIARSLARRERYRLASRCETCGAEPALLAGIYPRSCLAAVRRTGEFIRHDAEGVEPFRSLCMNCLKQSVGACWLNLSDDFWKIYPRVRAPAGRNIRLRLAAILLEKERDGTSLDPGFRREAEAWGLADRGKNVIERYIRRFGAKNAREDDSALATAFHAERHIFKTAFRSAPSPP